MELDFLKKIDVLVNKIGSLETKLCRIEEKVDLSVSIQRNHLIRVMKKEPINDEMILYGKPYNDLSPEEAYRFYQEDKEDFIIIDVTANDGKTNRPIENAVKIPLEELSTRSSEIKSKVIPILVISERGVRSILACELLVKKGFFNVNNISGGHLYWPGHKENKANNPESAPN